MTDGVAPALPLAHGASMPRLGLGTWPMTGDQARDVVAAAIRAGYRRVDTAPQYGNEEAVGEGLRASGLAREELFITTKFNAEWHGEELVEQAWHASVKRLGVDYIDLLLIHWPNPWWDRNVAAWQGLIAQNLDIFDFTLTSEEIASISSLDRGESAARDSDSEGH